MLNLKVSTRSSPLAIAQTELVKFWLNNHGCVFDEDLRVLTQGDKDLSSRLDQKGGKGLFIKEVEQPLIEGQAQLAVHSCKDMPLQQHADLIVAGLLGGASASDVLIGVSSLSELPWGAKVGTSSLRRAAQLLQLRPDLVCMPLRGNVGTRITSWSKGFFNAIVLAQAGLERLKIDTPYYVFAPHEIVPAFNQGILGIQVKRSEQALIKLLSDITDPLLKKRYDWERAIASCFESDCQSAVGVFVEPKSNLSCNVSIFAYKNKDVVRYAHDAFYDLEAALSWAKTTFELGQIDWRRCESVF